MKVSTSSWKLPYLEKLIIDRMHKVEKIGYDFLGMVNEDEPSLKLSSSSFSPKLNHLKIGFGVGRLGSRRGSVEQRERGF